MVLLAQVFLMFIFFAKCPVNFIFVLSKLADTLEELRQMTARGGKKLSTTLNPPQTLYAYKPYTLNPGIASDHTDGSRQKGVAQP